MWRCTAPQVSCGWLSAQRLLQIKCRHNNRSLLHNHQKSRKVCNRLATNKIKATHSQRRSHFHEMSVTDSMQTCRLQFCVKLVCCMTEQTCWQTWERPSADLQVTYGKCCKVTHAPQGDAVNNRNGIFYRNHKYWTEGQHHNDEDDDEMLNIWTCSELAVLIIYNTAIMINSTSSSLTRYSLTEQESLANSTIEFWFLNNNYY